METNNPYGLFNHMKSAKHKVVTPEQAKRKHDEATLHLQFCGWLKINYPNILFVRHEKERHRTNFTGGLMKKYNSLDGLPDFECLHDSGRYMGLYIEFKKPGEYWLEARTNYVKKAYTHQYTCHLHLWSINRCAYFCNDLDSAKEIFINYLQGTPINAQVYNWYKVTDNVEEL